MNDKAKLDLIRKEVSGWSSKQGHDRCWYYPDIFRRIADILEIEIPEAQLPPREEFEAGCRRYQREEYDGDQRR